MILRRPPHYLRILDLHHHLCSTPLMFLSSPLLQLYFYRDSLAYLANLKLATIHVVFGFYSLLAFYVIFEVVFCFGVYEKVCMNPAYNTVRTNALPPRGGFRV